MKVDNFFTILNEQLEVYKHQYERKDEGKVYIGLPDFDFSNLTKDEKTYFVYYLSFFIAFDLLVYSYDNQNYTKQKEKLKIPKFEYGLTNILVYPNKIYDKYLEPFRPEIFKVVFQLGIQYLNFKLPEIKPISIFQHAINDKDFSIGMFNNELLNEIKTAANKVLPMVGRP
jgi:hypothetical protein